MTLNATSMTRRGMHNQIQGQLLRVEVQQIHLTRIALFKLPEHR
jgi:hypothetical protein